MFFAPPKVKSLSQYAEFGLYLSHRDFFVMVGIAAFIHLGIIGVYSLVPRQEVVRIPVRALNIKLGGGVAQDEMPTPAPAPKGVADDTAPAQPGTPVREEPHEKATQAMLDKAFSKPATPAGAPRPGVYDSRLRRPRQAAPNPSAKTLPISSAEANMETPKKYVRENALGGDANARDKGKGGSAAGGKGGEEIIQRYEQTISLWISQHKAYPEAAKVQGVEGDAVVRIRIDRDGRILYSNIDRSSGNALIDQTVLAMVQASNPLPRVPEDYPDASQLEFLIPVGFRLQ